MHQTIATFHDHIEKFVRPGFDDPTKERNTETVETLARAIGELERCKLMTRDDINLELHQYGYKGIWVEDPVYPDQLMCFVIDTPYGQYTGYLSDIAAKEMGECAPALEAWLEQYQTAKAENRWVKVWWMETTFKFWAMVDRLRTKIYLHRKNK